MYGADQLPREHGARPAPRPASLLWGHCVDPSGSPRFQPRTPGVWCSVAPRWPGEVVHPVAAWPAPTEGHEEWSPRESLLMAVYRFPGHAGCV